MTTLCPKTGEPAARIKNGHLWWKEYHCSECNREISGMALPLHFVVPSNGEACPVCGNEYEYKNHEYRGTEDDDSEYPDSAELCRAAIGGGENVVFVHLYGHTQSDLDSIRAEVER